MTKRLIYYSNYQYKVLDGYIHHFHLVLLLNTIHYFRYIHLLFLQY